MVHGKLRNIVQIALITLVIASLLLRSLVGGLLVAMPLGLTVAVNFGVMGLLGIPLDTITSAISAMAVGIGADYAIYFLFRVREELAHGGRLEDALERALMTSGKAVFFVSSAIAFGYATLCLSGFGLHVPLASLLEVGGRRARVRADRVAVEALVDEPGHVLRLGGERPGLLTLERQEGPHEEHRGGHGRGSDGTAEERPPHAEAAPPRRREVHRVQRVEGAAPEENERHEPDLSLLAPLEELVDVAGRRPLAPVGPELREAGEEEVRGDGLREREPRHEPAVAREADQHHALHGRVERDEPERVAVVLAVAGHAQVRGEDGERARQGRERDQQVHEAQREPHAPGP